MPAFGSFGQMMIDVGVNLSSLSSGLAQAKGQLAGFNVIGSQAAAGVSSAFGGTALKIGALAGAIYAIQSSFTAAINAADEYRLAVLNVASTLYDMLDKPKKDQQDFNDLLDYSREMYKVLELEAVRHFASGKDLQLAWMILTQKGVALRYDEVNALGIVVDKIKLITQGQISTIQITQELRSMLNGQARVTDQLAILLEGRYGKAWKDIVQEQRKSGNLIKWLAQEFEGLARAQEYIKATIESQATTLWTMVRRIGRDGLLGAYDLIASTLRTINEYLIKHETTISTGIARAWGALEPSVVAVGNAIKDMIAYIYGSGDAFVTVAGYILLFTEAIIAAGKAFVGFIEAHAWILKLIVAFLAMNIAVKIIGSIAAALTTLVLALIEAGVSIGVFLLAGSGLGIVASGFIGIGIAVVALVGIVLGAISVVESFAAAAAGAIKRVRDSASFATGITPEEYIKRFRSKTYAGAQPAEILKASEFRVEEKKLSPEERRKVMMPGSAIGGALPEETGGTAVKMGTEEWDKLIASGKPFAAYDPKSTDKKIRFFNTLEPTQEQRFEAASLDRFKFTPTPDKAGPKGKGPEKLLSAQNAAVKAERAYGLQVLKNQLELMEKQNELDKDMWENKLNLGEINGQEFVDKMEKQNEDTYNAKKKIIAEERVLDEWAYAEKRANIEKEIVRDALSEQRAGELRLAAYWENRKQQKVRDKEDDLAEQDRAKKKIEQLAKDIKTRMDLYSKATALMTEAAWGPIEERTVKLLEVSKKFGELRKEVDAVGFGKDMKPSKEMTKLMEDMKEAAEALERPWAKDFLKGAELMDKAGATTEEKAAGRALMKSGLSDAEAEQKFRVRYEQMINSMKDAATTGFSDMFTSTIASIQNGTANLGAELQKIIVNMFNNMLNAALKPGFEALGQWLQKGIEYIVKAGMSAMGFGGGGGSDVLYGGSHTDNINQQAYGNAFYHGIRQAYAFGGIVSRPTIFAMAGGMGLMGEAGPEAVMPLVRLPGGKLGVAAIGGGGGVSITVNNNAKNTEASADQGPAGDIIITIDELTAKAYSRRGALHKVINAGGGITRR